MTELQQKKMVRFVCNRCKRPLVWAETSASVLCPSCGRWVRANKFWLDRESAAKGARKKAQIEQMQLF